MKVICPKCKSEHTAPIMYGYPAPEAWEASERGEIILGGCMVFPHQEDYGCLDCNHRWSLNSLPAEDIKKMRIRVFEQGLCTIDMARAWVYEIYADGTARKYDYQGRSRKALFSEKEQVPERKTIELFREFQNVMSKYPEEVIVAEVLDGCGYNLQVTYSDNRKRIIKGDLGGGTIDNMVMEFFGKIFDVEE